MSQNDEETFLLSSAWWSGSMSVYLRTLSWILSWWRTIHGWRRASVCFYKRVAAAAAAVAPALLRLSLHQPDRITRRLLSLFHSLTMNVQQFSIHCTTKHTLAHTLALYSHLQNLTLWHALLLYITINISLYAVSGISLAYSTSVLSPLLARLILSSSM